MTDHKADVDRYIAGVQDGSIVTGRLVKAAVRRHLQDLEQGAKRGLHFDEQAANWAINVFCCLSHTSGEYAGQPFVPRLFQKFILWCVYGWKKTGNGTRRLRRFRKAFISMARGNGKSPLGAGMANVCFRADTPIEPRAEVYAVATKEKQARIVWEEAAQQIRKSQSASFKNAVVIQKKNMHMPSNGSKFEALGSDSETNDGWSIHCAILDELHAWKEKTHRGLFDVIETAMHKRRQPLEVIITTAGTDESLIWVQERDWAEAVVTGLQESDDLFVFLAEIDRDQPCNGCDGAGCKKCGQTGIVELDCLDEALWPQSNPMLNEPEPTVKVDVMRTKARKARRIPAELNTFRRYFANQKIGSNEAVYTSELWNRGNQLLGELDGRRCYAGFDWGHKRDLAALALVFPFEELKQYHIKVWSWLPRDCEYDLLSDPWAALIQSDALTVTDGESTDTEAIWSTMKECVGKYEVASLAFDPCNAREFGTRCVNEWNITTYGFGQNPAKYNEPMGSFEDALRNGQVHHGGNKLLAWCAGNTVAHRDSMNRRMPTKLKSKNKIDPIVAMLMAWSEMKFAEREAPPARIDFEVIIR